MKFNESLVIQHLSLDDRATVTFDASSNLSIGKYAPGGVLIEFSCFFEESVQFPDGGFVVYHMESDTPLVKVSGCVTFGGSISIAIPQNPNISIITLMTFNSSTGRFDHVDIDGVQFCSARLEYLPQALVLDLKKQ